MLKNKKYILYFSSLTNGDSFFSYKIGNSFFENIDDLDFTNPNLNVDLRVEKTAILYVLHFTIKGSFDLQCDLSLELFKHKLSLNNKLIVKFGDFMQEYDDMLILPNGSDSINIYDYIYDMIVLSVPMKKKHPKIDDGTIKSLTLDILKRIEV